LGEISSCAVERIEKRELLIADCLLLLNVLRKINFVGTQMKLGSGGGDRWVCGILLPKTTVEVEIEPLGVFMSSQPTRTQEYVDPSIHSIS
jgi:hypothetical protein